MSSWRCCRCEYDNAGAMEYCEMCDNQRVVQQDDKKMGDWVCARCTLINGRDASECNVCGGLSPDAELVQNLALQDAIMDLNVESNAVSDQKSKENAQKEGYIYLQCPHCSGTIQVKSGTILCGVFTHGSVGANQIDPHSTTKAVADHKATHGGNFLGCGGKSLHVNGTLVPHTESGDHA